MTDEKNAIRVCLSGVKDKGDRKVSGGLLGIKTLFPLRVRGAQVLRGDGRTTLLRMRARETGTKTQT